MVNYKYSDLFNKDSVDKQVKIEYDCGTITNDELFSESIELTESLCSENELRFGCCEASVLKFKVANIMQPLSGKWLTVSETMKNCEDAPFLIGKYKVTSDKPTADRRYREITAYDAMSGIISADVTNWYNSVLPTKESTMTMKNFRTSFIQYFGIEQEEVALINDDMMVEKTVEPAEISGKDVITAICEINGCFGHIGRNGKFQYIYLEQETQGLYPKNDLYPMDDLYPRDPKSTQLGKGIYISCQYEDFLTKPINKLQIRKKENDIGSISGTGDNCYIIEDNFLLYGKNSDQLKIIGDNIYNKIRGIIYQPFDCEAKGNPCMEVGDAIRLLTKYEIVESYILKRTLRGIQALRDNYSADGAKEYSKKVNAVNKSIVQLKGKLNTLERTVEETQSTIADTEEGLQTQITQNTKSIIEEVRQREKNENELSSRIELTVKSISMTVNNGDETAGIEISIENENGDINKVTGTIQMTGLVSFRNLSTSGETVINGENIATGTINCNLLNGGEINGQCIRGGTIDGTEITGQKITGGTITGSTIDTDKLKIYDKLVMTFPETGAVNKGETITILSLNNYMEPPVIKFGRSDINYIDCLCTLACDKELFVNKSAYFNGNIYLQKTKIDGSPDNQYINAYWKDDNVHSVLTVNEDALTTGIGWNGVTQNSDGTEKKYATVLNLRGQTVKAPNVGGVTITSDERLKNSFENLDVFDEVYMDLCPISFKYNNGKSGRKHFGFGAGQVKKAFENHEFSTEDFAGFVQMLDDPESEDYCGIEDPMGLIYTEFVAWNTHMIQKLYKKVELQQKEIEDLKRIVEELRERGVSDEYSIC